ncbi:hypothetical protein AZA_32828 [Nitrospirillum viridazoti Y2]|nr:hypothetical protein AZA_32828 [Nitrospirillum amazonense Y2]
MVVAPAAAQIDHIDVGAQHRHAAGEAQLAGDQAQAQAWRRLQVHGREAVALALGGVADAHPGRGRQGCHQQGQAQESTCSKHTFHRPRPHADSSAQT